MPLLIAQGLALHKQGKFNEAKAIYEKVLTIQANTFDALNLLGVLSAQTKQFTKAVDFLTKALQINLNHADAYYNHGLSLQELKRLDEALTSYDRAISIKPDYAEAYCNRGSALQELKRLDEALTSYDRAISIKPDYANAFCNRGDALNELNRFDEALSSCDRAISIEPDFAEAHSNRGNALKELKRLDEALTSYDRAISIKPDYAKAYCNRGTALKELNRLDEALTSYDKAISIKPDYAEAHSNRGIALVELNRLDEALTSYDRAICIKPDLAIAYWNQSLCNLLNGNFKDGWEGYEWRWKYKDNRKLGEVSPKLELGKPWWNGEFLDGTLLAWGEQGIGDQILFAGMLPQLARHARAVMLAVDPRLVALFQRSFPGINIVSKDSPLQHLAFDAHVVLGSIGQHLRKRWADFPEKNHNYLFPNDNLSPPIRERITDGSIICGLSWASRNNLNAADKSILLKDLQPILALKNVQAIDLQYGDTATERKQLHDEFALRITHVDEIDNFNDIDGLAALISACDVVVTISNTTAHLAGALGKPTLLMLPFGGGRHWYWHEERSDSPWYPAIRIFRQTAAGRWNDVIARVKNTLIHW
ncbi:unannotated protein [freshwater metagenome]|uniref:Unannotated protein n=1 Tax=freshwater metagenome TaxID=449393 RepID=A0A6J6Q4P7_9ZZZZ